MLVLSYMCSKSPDKKTPHSYDADESAVVVASADDDYYW